MAFARPPEMDRFTQDLRIAVRSLGRQPAFTLVAVLTLALGVGATTAIFSVVYGILLRPLPYADSGRLVTFGQTARTAPEEPVDGSTSHVNFLDWQRAATTIESMALYSGGRAVISNQGEADVVRIGSVTPDFFTVFQAAPILGRAFTAAEGLPGGPRAVILGYGFWQERFGGRDDVLAQTIEISGVPWPIVGVAPRGFEFPGGARLWAPVRNDDERCGRSCVYLNGIGRLAEGASVQAAQQELAGIAAVLEQSFPDDNTGVSVMVQSLHDRTVGRVRLGLLVVLGAVGMVLLIACANVANLVLVRGAARHGELAVRTALGAGRRGVVSYLLTENLVLAVAGGATGLVLAWWGIDALVAFAPPNLPRLDDVRFDAPTFGFALAVVGATTLLFGLVPAWQLARLPPAGALGQRGTVGAGGMHWTRSTLLVAEVALSLVLLLGAGLLLRSVSALQGTDVGFTADGLSVLTVSLPPARYPAPQVVATHDRLDEALSALPGVSRVARIGGLPLGPSENVLNFLRPDQPPPAPGQVPLALYRIADPEYFVTMGIPLLAGRVFEPSDRAGAQRVVVISRKMADVYWPGEDPVGRPIQVSGQDPAIVAGVVANVRSQALATVAQPEMYVPHAQTEARTHDLRRAQPPRRRADDRRRARGRAPAGCAAPADRARADAGAGGRAAGAAALLPAARGALRRPRARPRRRRPLRRRGVPGHAAHARDRRAHGAGREPGRGGDADAVAGAAAGDGRHGAGPGHRGRRGPGDPRPALRSSRARPADVRRRVGRDPGRRRGRLRRSGRARQRRAAGGGAARRVTRAPKNRRGRDGRAWSE